MAWSERQSQTYAKFLEKGMPGSALEAFAVPAAKTIFFENPEINQEEFNKEIVERARILVSLEKTFARTIRKLGKKKGYFTYKFFDQSGIAESGLSFKEQVQAYKLNMRFIPFWLKSRTSPLGNFSPYRFHHNPNDEAPRAHDKIGNWVLSHNILVHDEMPLSLCLSKTDGQIMASIGGYLYMDGNRPAICITNVQGTRPERIDGESAPDFRNRKELHLKEYQKINEFLKENWRVWFVREVVKIGKAKGLAVTGRIRFSHFGQTKGGEYRRLVRQYRQAFRKAGLTPETPTKFKLAGRPKHV